VFLFPHATASRFQLHLNVLVWMLQCWISKLSLNNDAIGFVFQMVEMDFAANPMHFKLKSFNVFA
jgi:hypothetical protein